MGNGEWGMGGGEGHVAIAYTIKLKHGERLFFFFKIFLCVQFFKKSVYPSGTTIPVVVEVGEH